VEGSDASRVWPHSYAVALAQPVPAGVDTGNSSAAPPSRRILVVDDEEGIRQVVNDILTLEGYEVREASDGLAALDLLRTYPARVILLDMRMPVMDGWTFAERYRQFPDARAAVVVMTAAQDARKWASDIGADGVLSKPFEVDDLLKLVENLLR
jgi:CheY-like chemotaxis protein